MSLEKMNMEGAYNPSTEIDENALMPKEKAPALKAEIKESNERLRKLTTDFNILSEDDFFESREKLESILDKINDIKVEQQILSDKLQNVLNIQEDFSKENLQKELDDNIALKN